MTIKGFTNGMVKVCRTPVYWPAHNKNGKEISARLVVPAMSNNIGRKQDDGTRADVEDTYMEFTLWGKQADTYVKYLHVGKAFCCEFEIKSYRATVFEDRRPVVGKDGQPLKKRAYSYNVIPGTVRLGKDGIKTINEELSSGVRPIGYDGKIRIADLQNALAKGMDMNAFLDHLRQGEALWKTNRAEWKKQSYQPGMTKFGYADVRLPDGAVAAPNAYQQPQAVPQTGNEPRVDGFTYQDMIAHGWSNEQLLTADGGKWAVLVPQAMRPPQAPPAPQSVPTPPAPAASFENAGV